MNESGDGFRPLIEEKKAIIPRPELAANMFDSGAMPENKPIFSGTVGAMRANLQNHNLEDFERLDKVTEQDQAILLNNMRIRDIRNIVLGMTADEKGEIPLFSAELNAGVAADFLQERFLPAITKYFNGDEIGTKLARHVEQVIFDLITYETQFKPNSTPQTVTVSEKAILQNLVRWSPYLPALLGGTESPQEQQIKRVPISTPNPAPIQAVQPSQPPLNEKRAAYSAPKITPPATQEQPDVVNTPYGKLINARYDLDQPTKKTPAAPISPTARPAPYLSPASTETPAAIEQTSSTPEQANSSEEKYPRHNPPHPINIPSPRVHFSANTPPIQRAFCGYSVGKHAKTDYGFQPIATSVNIQLSDADLMRIANSYVGPVGKTANHTSKDEAPIDLAYKYIRDDQGNKINLVSQTRFTGSEYGRSGAFFTDLFVGVPQEFTPAVAALWGSDIFQVQSTEENKRYLAEHGSHIDAISMQEITNGLQTEFDPEALNLLPDVLPAFLEATALQMHYEQRLMQEVYHERSLKNLKGSAYTDKVVTLTRDLLSKVNLRKIVLAAPDYQVATVCRVLSECIPPQLLDTFSFSTYRRSSTNPASIMKFVTSNDIISLPLLSGTSYLSDATYNFSEHDIKESQTQLDGLNQTPGKQSLAVIDTYTGARPKVDSRYVGEAVTQYAETVRQLISEGKYDELTTLKNKFSNAQSVDGFVKRLVSEFTTI